MKSISKEEEKDYWEITGQILDSRIHRSYLLISYNDFCRDGVRVRQCTQPPLVIKPISTTMLY